LGNENAAKKVVQHFFPLTPPPQKNGYQSICHTVSSSHGHVVTWSTRHNASSPLYTKVNVTRF